MRYKTLVRNAALALSMGALLSMAVGCGDDDDDSETPLTPTTAARSTLPADSPTTATSPAGATDCPVDERICAHAAEIERALRAGDANAVIGASAGQPVTCAGGAGGQLDPTLRLCEGATPGEVRVGVVRGTYQSEASTVTVAGANGAIKEWLADLDATAADDEYGAADATVFTFGCDTRDSCEEAYAIVASGIASDGQRTVLNLTFRPGDTPDLLGIFTGSASLNAALVTGGAHEGGLIAAAGATAEYELLPRDQVTGAVVHRREAVRPCWPEGDACGTPARVSGEVGVSHRHPAAILLPKTAEPAGTAPHKRHPARTSDRK